MTPDFVNTLEFLTDEQCMRLREADLDIPAAFEHITVAHLLAPPFHLTLGKASRLDGSPLQAGAGEVSGVMWGELGLDGLRAAAFGYQEGLFEGRPEEAVFAAMKSGGSLREKVLGRMRALSVKPEVMDRIVVFTPTPQGHVEVAFSRPAPRVGASLVGNLSALFVSAFSVDELRRFITHTIGRAFADALPGPAGDPCL